MRFFFKSRISLNIFKILSLRINTLIPPLLPLFKTVLELLQSDSLQGLRHFFPHLLYILKMLSFKVPLHSWKQEKIAGCQVRGVRGAKPLSSRFSWETVAHSMLCGQEHCRDAEATHLTATVRWHELHETPVNASNSSIVQRRSNIIASRIFLMFLLVLLVEGRPDRG